MAGAGWRFVGAAGPVPSMGELHVARGRVASPGGGVGGATLQHPREGSAYGEYAGWW